MLLVTSKKIALYARVSTEGQAEEGFSIEAQLEKMRKNAENDDHQIVGEYIDRGISGKSMSNRPALLSMLEDAKNNKFQEVCVWKISRIARNNLDLLTIDRMLQEHNVSLRSYTEAFDTSTPTGKLLFNVLAGISEFERETIVDNVRSGMKQRARQGFFNGGRMLGYKSVPSENIQEKNKLVIIPEEAEIVKLIFELYSEGKGYKFISNYLNDCNYKTINGLNFGIQSIRNIIKNPTYAGYVQFNKTVKYASKRREGGENDFIRTKGKHEAIVDLETWSKVQQINQKKSLNHTKKVKRGTFLLTGILKCPQCGSPMVAGRVVKNKGGRKIEFKYYQCSKYKNKGRKECSANSVNAEYIEEYVIDYLSKFSFSDDMVDRVVQKINKQVKTTVLPLKKQIETKVKELGKIEKRKSKVYTLYENEDITLPEFKDRKMQIEKEKRDIEASIEDLKAVLIENSTVQEIPVAYVKDLMTKFGNLLTRSTREEQKILLYSIVERITVDQNRKIEKIILRFTEHTNKVLLKEDSSEEEPSFLLSFMLVL